MGRTWLCQLLLADLCTDLFKHQLIRTSSAQVLISTCIYMPLPPPRSLRTYHPGEYLRRARMGNSYSILQQLSREEQEEYEYARMVEAVETAQAVQSTILNNGQHSGRVEAGNPDCRAALKPVPAALPVPGHLTAQTPSQQYNAYRPRHQAPTAAQVAFSSTSAVPPHAPPRINMMSCESVKVSLVLGQF